MSRMELGRPASVKRRLKDLLLQSDNRICADCGAPDPKWASANIGVFICLKCCGVHRSLGTHVSKVLSVTLDEWSEDEVDAMMKVGGNASANSIYEAFIPDGVLKPGRDSSHEERSKFIRSKYELQEFLEPSLRISSGKNSASLQASCSREILDSFRSNTSQEKTEKQNRERVMDDQWKKLSGAGNWDDLLKPLDEALQKRLDLCRESIQVIYDSVSHHDKRQPAHKKEDLFSKMKTKEFGKLYTVTHYIYARSDVPSLVNWIVKDKSAWIGYVAVATDEGKEVLGRRDILICWRGTSSKTEWLKDFECSLISASDIFGKTHNPHLHKGFLSLYKSPNIEPASYNKWSARDQVLHAVKTLVNKVDYRDEEISITVTGHSLGGVLATLSATDIVANKHNRCTGSGKICMVTAFVFASPKVGDKGFREVFDQLSELHPLHLLRIKNKLDVVPKLPPSPPYEHVGLKLETKSCKELLSKLGEGLHFHSLKQHLQGLWTNCDVHI